MLAPALALFVTRLICEDNGNWFIAKQPCSIINLAIIYVLSKVYGMQSLLEI
jgi:hypothetical protein